MRAVGARYRIVEKIGGGSFGTVFKGVDAKTGIPVAIKVEKDDISIPQLSNESKVYTILQGSTNVPRHHYFGRDNHALNLVIDLGGKSVEDLMKECGGKLTLKTVLMLADQMISAVEFMHKKGIIHRDIKPDNFVVGRDNLYNKLFIIDYGLAKNYLMPDGTHIVFQDHKPLTGTARYASISTLKGFEQSRRDDMESLAYIFFYLLNGGLPWMNVRAPTNQIKYDKILAIKTVTPIEELGENLPIEFSQFLAEVRELEFSEEPNYAKYRRMFRDLFMKKGYIYDYIFDWTKPDDTKPRSKSAKKPPAVLTSFKDLNIANLNVGYSHQNTRKSPIKATRPVETPTMPHGSTRQRSTSFSAKRTTQNRSLSTHSTSSNNHSTHSHQHTNMSKNSNNYSCSSKTNKNNNDLIRKKSTTSAATAATSSSRHGAGNNNSLSHSKTGGTSRKTTRKASENTSGAPKFQPVGMSLRAQMDPLRVRK
ncbi:Casein kinase I isoform delta-like protein [Tritrichomonas foetus]|uniref:non-specific serine/threonine protein kinase n=1 Tax=Tritrichomonas foetus TaxID=1144522 RepID=A0A1J4KX99_9EUKA|nr:Casein kinase I isoform delta-like protein [Tritrichomonas foetus]|eukprot:OHT14181.1 Casein kinase I isoform delta-like protein [Tritrichomonas foetus]